MRKILYMVCVTLMAFSCAKDDSVLMYPNNKADFSLIKIESPLTKLSIDFGESFNFTPDVTQLVTDKKLEYIWTANELDQNGQKGQIFTIGNEATLKYRFDKYGTFNVRLEVKNEDCSTFKEWEASVRVYDEGHYVLGVNDAGECNLAFARKLSATEINNGQKLTFGVDLLNKINPDANITNVVKVNKQVTSYNGVSTPTFIIFTHKKVYIANADTFKIDLTVSIDDFFPGEKIIDANALDNYGPTYNVFTDKGNTYDFSVAEYVFIKSQKYFCGFDKAYSNLNYFYGADMTSDVVWVTNSPEPKVWLFGGYYSTIPVNNTSGSDKPNVDGAKPNVYAGRNIIAVTRMNGYSYGGGNPFYSISVSKTNSRDVKILGFSGPENTVWTDLSKIEYTATEDITLKSNSIIQPNARYQWICYSNGSKIYCWYPKNTPPYNRLPTVAAIDLGAGKEVTAMQLSYNTKELYVGFYDTNNPSDLKGGLAIFNASKIDTEPDLKPDKIFEGITTRPIQVGYKSKGMGVFEID